MIEELGLKNDWYKVLDNINSLKGKQKQLFLEENKDNNKLKDILVFLFDDRISTGISKKKLSKQVEINQLTFKDSYDRVLSLIDYLKKHNTGKDNDIVYIKSVINTAENDLEKTYLEKLVVKDMKIGLTKTTINKVFPNLIFNFKPMKLTKYSSELFPKENIVMPKLDGNYCCVYCDEEDNVKYFARSGKEYEGLNHLDMYFIDKPGVYFGEIVIPSHFEEHTKDFQKSNGILNSKGDKSSLGIVLFDMYDKELTFEKRLLKLGKILYLDIWDPNYKEYEEDAYIMPVLNFSEHDDFYYNYDEETLMKDFHKYKDMGYEGLVVYNRNNIWQPKRVKDILKLKGSYSCDLKVLDIFEHKNGGKLGGVIVDYKGNQLKVGSGFLDEDRQYYWNNKDKIIGKIVEVEYFTTSTNKEGIESLRHPVFKRIRNDKKDVSYD